MVDEILAYYLGKSAGRKQERASRRDRRAITRDGVVRARIVFAVICFCIVVAVAVALVGHNPY